MPEPPFAWIGDAVGFLRRNRRIVLACPAACLVLALLYLATASPRFTASATLLVDMPQMAPFQQHSSVDDAQIQSALIESEVEVLRSAGLARQAVAQLRLAHDPAFNGASSLLSRFGSMLRPPLASGKAGLAPASAAEDRLVAHFMQAVSAHRIGLTYIIQIDATATTRELAARLANGLAQSYLAERLAVRDASAATAAGWLQTRLVQLHDQALAADRRVQLFKARSGIVDTGHGLLNEQQLTELNSELVAARARTARASARLDRIRELTKPGSDPGLAVSDVLNSPVITGLRERYLNDAVRSAEWSAQFGPGNRAVITLRKEMAELQASIRNEVRRIEQTAVSDLAVDRAAEAAIQAQLDTLVGQSASTGAARATLRSLQSSSDTYRALYTAFLQRAVQAVQDESFPLADARIVTPARPPLSKSGPRGKLILAAAIVIGLGGGFLVALLAEALDQRLRSPGDLRARAGLACLACLPAVLPGAASGSYVLEHPDAPFGIGIRRLQLRLRQQGNAGRARLVGLVAPAAGAGTSMVAANLVRSLAASGCAASLLPLSGQIGRQSEIREEIERLRGGHDIVVLDFPALDRPVEAHTLLSEVGSLALLLEAGRFDAPSLLETLRMAGLDRRSILGVVLNRVPAYS